MKIQYIPENRFGRNYCSPKIKIRKQKSKSHSELKIYNTKISFRNEYEFLYVLHFI